MTFVNAGLPDPPLPFTGGRFPASEIERERVERRVLLLFLAAPGLAFAVLLAGFALGWPRLTSAGVIALGLTVLAVGLLAVAERRLLFVRRNSLIRREHLYVVYEGFAAVPYGLALAVVGAALCGLGIAVLAGMPPEAVRAAILARPGWVLVPLGLAFLLHGLGFAIGFARRAASAGDRLGIALLHLPSRLGGLILVVWGAGLLAAGTLDALQPALFDRWFEAAVGAPWPFRAH